MQSRRTISSMAVVAIFVTGVSAGEPAANRARRPAAANASATPAGSENLTAADRQYLTRRKNQLRAIEQSLARQTTGGGVNGWYVLAFHDTTRRVTPPQPIGGGRWRTYASLDGAEVTHYALVEGRSAAAEAIQAFSEQGSESAGKLYDTGYQHQTQTDKTWEFRYFVSYLEAEQLYSQVSWSPAETHGTDRAAR